MFRRGSIRLSLDGSRVDRELRFPFLLEPVLCTVLPSLLLTKSSWPSFCRLLHRTLASTQNRLGPRGVQRGTQLKEAEDAWNSWILPKLNALYYLLAR